MQNNSSSTFVQPDKESDRLSVLIPAESKWDVRRSFAADTSHIYWDNGFEKYGQRIDDCSKALRFVETMDPKTGEFRFKLERARFCRVRLCAVCQWRKSLSWIGRFHRALPKVIGENPKGRWLFLTLTVKNVEVGDLRSELKEMNKAWGRLVKRKVFKSVKGWVRSTEVTRSKDGLAHPHFHVLLLVGGSYFGRDYVTQADWQADWRKSARLDYEPIIDIRAVKALKKLEGEFPFDLPVSEGLNKAVVETLKYTTKPSDLVADPAWLVEFTKQIFRMRFTASGGVLKGVLREQDEPTDDELSDPADEVDDDAEARRQIDFGWQAQSRYYNRKRGS